MNDWITIDRYAEARQQADESLAWSQARRRAGHGYPRGIWRLEVAALAFVILFVVFGLIIVAGLIAERWG